MNSEKSLFEFVFKIEPAGDFGLPDNDAVVVKAVEGMQTYTAAIDRVTGNIVAHGTVSRYRDETEAIQLNGQIETMQLRLHDNFLTISIEETDYATSEKTVLGAVDHFIQLLSFNRDSYFRAEFIQATERTGDQYRPARQPRKIPLGKIQFYNLTAFTESLSWAFQTCPLAATAELAKALDYFNHAQFLMKVRDDLPFGYLRAHGYLAADIFSNFYKAASVLVGDPTKDKDWQSRYKTIGLSYEFWKEKVEHVRTLRNSYGVAHYDLDGKHLDTELETAAKTAKTVITHYIQSIQPKEAPAPKA